MIPHPLFPREEGEFQVFSVKKLSNFSEILSNTPCKIGKLVVYYLRKVRSM